ncbi:MAG: hypothetical protein HRU41_35895 [Saprospiraceae bacterium]|nr:hypothetical protein [Saprospiraceae bacterium]
MTDESFNQDFCEFLEFHLCKTFRKADDKALRRLWCDGVAWKHCSKKEINDKREINTIAWIGEDGQDEFEMKIKLGKYALRRYVRGTDMTDCIPDSDLADWIMIDIENRFVQIQLR